MRKRYTYEFDYDSLMNSGEYKPSSSRGNASSLKSAKACIRNIRNKKDSDGEAYWTNARNFKVYDGCQDDENGHTLLVYEEA